MNPLAQATLEMESALNSKEVMEYYAKIYDSLYRSDCTFTIKDHPELEDEMVTMCAEFLAKKTGKYIVIEQPFECKFGYDEVCYEDEILCDPNKELVDSFKEKAIAIVKAGATFTWLCNYKGEDAGFDLVEAVNHLQVYVSKYNYI